MKRIHYCYFLLGFMIFSCTSAKKNANPMLLQGEGFVEVKGGKIWYGIMGEGDNVPLLCLHGGPGGTSKIYYKLSEIAKERPVIMFDQLGTGRSGYHQDTTLLKPELFVEQVKAIKDELNLNEFFLVGSSWGAALALEYYTTYPEGIKGIVFNSPYFSTSIWTDDAAKLVAQLPDSIQSAIHLAERDSVFDTESYIAANSYFASKHGKRKVPVKHPYDTVPSNRNNFIYNYMWGPSEFTATGTLRNFDNHQSLKKITVPTLMTTGEYDEARPETVMNFAEMVPNAKFVLIPESGHSTLNDNGPAVLAAIQQFIKTIEKK
ncbi:proline iminopeptidase-family hydrolase [Lutimonas saemankumensis]|uniref:proline iminopeptidase-family hydrolase n=1 Tax=Lutimonas saemankumensis TaxID=483016 RepID=UPI001CD25EE9|nr:proline iminopeptidase-family hydrolase [Lutimonas saemankumensis]MCA0931374.1 proline iminopeptidase-family hydrolase [Lutimonas saemankumensis]